MPSRRGWYFRDRAGSWQPYARKVSREIEEMYTHGAPHCLYRPGDLSLCDMGSHQPDALQGWMVGETPPPNVCTHRILFDRMVDIDVYAGTHVQVMRAGPASADRQKEENYRKQHPMDARSMHYERGATIANAGAFGLQLESPGSVIELQD